MKNNYVVLREQGLIMARPEGKLNVQESKRALQEITSNPDYDQQFEVLMNLTKVESDLDPAGIFEIASSIAYPDSIFPTRRKIAIVVSGAIAFDHAAFLELCANNRGVNIKSFSRLESATDWLGIELPHDQRGS
ncbi:MAG: hypothetical protein ACTS2F_20905 [Thainema sp.]